MNRLVIPEKLPEGITLFIEDDVAVAFDVTVGSGENRQRRRFNFKKCGGMERAYRDAMEFREGYLKTQQQERKNGSIPIPDRLRPRIAAALALLERYPEVDICDAVQFYVDHRRVNRVASEVTFAHARKEYLEFKKLQERDSAYQRNIEFELEAFGQSFDSRKLSTIMAAEIEEWLSRREMGPVTWNNWRRDLRTFFNFALSERNRWVVSNPAAQVAEKGIKLEEVEILENKEVKELLKKAAAYNDGRQVAWLTLGLFAGLRREEADAASWADIMWETGTVRVHAAKAHDVVNRYVHMEPTLKAWLEWCNVKRNSEPLVTKKYARRNDLAELSTETGLELNKNLYRHSFGSNHVHAWKDKARTMLEMGHTSAKTFDGYYNKPRPKMVALAYWDLTPETVLSV